MRPSPGKSTTPAKPAAPKRKPAPKPAAQATAVRNSASRVPNAAAVQHGDLRSILMKAGFRG